MGGIFLARIYVYVYVCVCKCVHVHVHTMLFLSHNKCHEKNLRHSNGNLSIFIATSATCFLMSCSIYIYIYTFFRLKNSLPFLFLVCLLSLDTFPLFMSFYIFINILFISPTAKMLKKSKTFLFEEVLSRINNEMLQLNPLYIFDFFTFSFIFMILSDLPSNVLKHAHTHTNTHTHTHTYIYIYIYIHFADLSTAENF